MSFDWVQYLKLAKDLAEKPEEAAQRSAISRAYYAAFHVVKDFLGIGEEGRDSGSVHAYVASQAMEDKRPAVVHIGRVLRRMSKSRACADYDDEILELPGSALGDQTEAALDDAKEVILEIGKLPGGQKAGRGAPPPKQKK